MEIKITKKTEELYKVIEVREPLVEDMIEAEKHGAGVKSAAALISQICTFDGKNITVEDVQKLPVNCFLSLQAELTTAGFLGLAEQSSTSSETVDLLIEK